MLKTALQVAAIALSMISLPAAAATVSLQYNGPSAGGDAKTVRITAAPVAFPIGNVGAFGFNMTDTTGALGSFMAWCLDIEHVLATSGTHPYTSTTSPFSNSFGLDGNQMARVRAVFDANFASLNAMIGNQAAGFQLALWNALYDTDSVISGGTFKATASTTITNLANSYLSAAASFTGSSAWNLTFLESTTGRQNLVTVSPVPLPAAGWLLIAGIGGLAALRRRKTA
jgi:hypothetical protein